jgi:hypothetical protein
MYRGSVVVGLIHHGNIRLQDSSRGRLSQVFGLEIELLRVNLTRDIEGIGPDKGKNDIW